MVDVTATFVVARMLSVQALCTVWLLQCAVTSAALIDQSTIHEIEQKPLLTWSAEEVTKLLTDSPWTSLSVHAATGQGPFRRTYYWRIRLLTAAPIRQAYLRYLVPVPDPRDVTVNYRDLKTEQTPESARSLYERFVAAHPDAIWLKKENEYIVLSVNQTWRIPDLRARPEGWRDIQNMPAGSDVWPPVVENTRPDLLVSLGFFDLVQCTFLSTDSGQKLALVRYDAPSDDHLGALFYFRRPLRNVEWIRPGDKELHFVTKIRGENLKATFNLHKLRFGGRLEY